MFNRHLLAAAALALTAGATFAQSSPTPTPVPAEKTTNHGEEQRIQEGKANGSLTKREAHRMQYQQARIRATERRNHKDGVVTPEEAAHVDAMQAKASKNIYDQKHDAQGVVAPGAPNK